MCVCGIKGRAGKGRVGKGREGKGITWLGHFNNRARTIEKWYDELNYDFVVDQNAMHQMILLAQQDHHEGQKLPDGAS